MTLGINRDLLERFKLSIAIYRFFLLNLLRRKDFTPKSVNFPEHKICLPPGCLKRLNFLQIALHRGVEKHPNVKIAYILSIAPWFAFSMRYSFRKTRDT